MADQASRLIEEARAAQKRFRDILASVGLDELRVRAAAARLRARITAAELGLAEREVRERLGEEQAEPVARPRPGSSALTVPAGIRA